MSCANFRRRGQFLRKAKKVVLSQIGHCTCTTLSRQISRTLLNQFYGRRGFVPISFHTCRAMGKRHLPVCRAGIVVYITASCTIIYLSDVSSIRRHRRIYRILQRAKGRVVTVSRRRVRRFTKGVLRIRGKGNTLFLIVSRDTCSSLSRNRLRQLSGCGTLLPVPVPAVRALKKKDTHYVVTRVFLGGRGRWVVGDL